MEDPRIKELESINVALLKENSELIKVIERLNIQVNRGDAERIENGEKLRKAEKVIAEMQKTIGELSNQSEGYFTRIGQKNY